MKPTTPQFGEALTGTPEKLKLGQSTKRNYPQLNEFLELFLKQKKLSEINKKGS